MKSVHKNTAAWLLGVGLLAVASGAGATNGYFTHGVGTASKGMAGTGIGSNADMGAIMSASNPALGVFAGEQWEVGMSIFSPRRSYEASPSQLNGNLIDLGNGSFLPSYTINPGKVDSSSEFFPIPYVAKNWQLDNGGAVTALFYGRGGMNTDWDDGNASGTSYFCGGNPFAGEPPATGPGPYCRGDAGVDLMQGFLSLTYSARISDNFTWGIGPMFAFQRFEAKGVSVFAPVTRTCVDGFDPFTQTCGGNPDSLSDNGHDMSYGFGLTAGLWWGMSDRVSLGLSYQTKMSMGEFDDYSDLFAEAGGFDIPSSLKAGLSFLATDALRVNFDVEHTAYSDVDSVGNPMANMLGCPALPFGGTDLDSCIGGGRGPGFGWDDMTTYKLGFEWSPDSQNTWRFGYSHGTQPIQAADVLFNVLAPGVMEDHITFGWTKKGSDGSAWDFSLMFAPKNDVTGPSMFDPTQTIKLEMSQFEFEVAYRFGGGQ